MSDSLYPPTSPYAATPVLSWRIGRHVHRAIPTAPDDDTVVVQPRHAGRPDTLAFELYGTPAYWWVLGETNPKLRLDPVRALRAGMVLRVPTRARLSRVLGQ